MSSDKPTDNPESNKEQNEPQDNIIDLEKKRKEKEDKEFWEWLRKQPTF